MDDDKLIEEAASQEMSKPNENIVDPAAEDISDDDQVIYEIPQSVLSCSQLGRDRFNSIERLLMEHPEDKSSAKDDIRGVTPNNCDDFLKELASECGEDLITLKKRIISEIEEEESSEVTWTASNENTTELIPHNDEDSDEYLETERQFRAELMNLERRLKAEEEKRMAKDKVMKERFLKVRKEEEERRLRRQQFFEEELKRIEYDNLVHQHLELDSEDSTINGRISKELSKQQELITGLQMHMVEERHAFEQVQAEQRSTTEEKQCRAATKIQASIRAFLVRTKNAVLLNERREERRQKKESQLRLEKERKEKENRIWEKLEELRITREEEQRRKEEKKRKEEERIRWMEEKKRQDEERIRQEEEKKRQDEERIRQEEEKRREEEERRKKEEENRRERERVKEAEARLERERKQKQEEEEARKRKEEEVRKQEELERQRRIEEEERQQREMEERKAEELRKLEEEERVRHQQKEMSSMEDSSEEEALIPGEKENPHCSSKEMFLASNSISSSTEVEHGKKCPMSNDTVSEGDQSEEEQYNWRLKCFYRTSQSSVSSSPDEIHTSVNSGEAVEAGQWQREPRPFLCSDKAVADDPDRPISSPSASPSDSADPVRMEWVKDCTPWAKPSPQNNRRLVLKTTIVRRGSAKSTPASDSIIQPASWNSHNEELMARQPGQSVEDSGQAEQRGLADLIETRASHRAFLLCKKSTALQDDRKDEWKKKEQHLQMEKEREEKEERARMKALEQRRAKEEEERARMTVLEERRRKEEEERARMKILEQRRRKEEEERARMKVLEQRRRKEEEERQLRETEEREAKELREEEERRREESHEEKAKAVPEAQPTPLCLEVKGEEEAAPESDRLASSAEPTQAQGSQAAITEAVTEPSEAEGHTPCSSLMCLPDSIEQKRLAWMKDCVPWSKLSLQNKRKQVVQAKSIRRGSVKALPPLSADTILRSAAWNSLKQVTTVTLEDLPGCSLSTLSECTKLQALTMRRCGLVALEGLSGCRGLKYIDLQENEIKFVNCKDLTKLRVLLLSQNQLTSIHGLEDAVNLDVLELSHNRISRLSGLGSQKRLQRLLIDHNQLISTRGLSELYTLLYLDCGYNHLNSMGDIENCALLSTLRLQGNNLTEPPSLKNHVLMKELYLDDNTVSSLDGLSACWLPLLQLISASKNSITHLPPLSHCVSLQKLDFSHNCLSELANVRHSLEGCSQLQEMSLSGNPFQQESNWRSSLLQTVPGLRRINGEWISSIAPPSGRAGSPPPGSFLGFCRAQLQQLERVQRRHEAQLSAPCPSDVPTVISQHCEELLGLAEEQRYAHEFGELTVADRTAPVSSSRSPAQDGLPAHAVEESSQDTAIGTSCSQEAEGNGQTSSSGPETSASTSGEDAGSQSAVTRDRSTNLLQNHPKNKPSKKPSQKFDLKNMAAAVIQSFWRGHRNRRAALPRGVRRVAVGDGVAGGNSVSVERVSREARLDQCRAATVIQAVWKGYALRSRLASALAAVRVGETDEEFAEVDVDEFAFDEAALDRDWITLDSGPQPSTIRPKPPAHPSTLLTSPSALACQPRQAWLGGESERAALSGRRSTSPEILELTHRTKSSLACVLGPPKEKSEKIMKEWGLRDRYTAQLMLKRAQKMRPKKRKDKRPGDPVAYLDLFRSSENKQAPVKAPKRNQPEKTLPFKDCLAAGEEEFDERRRISSEWTDFWLQTHANNLDTDRSSPTMESEHFLPEIDVDILNGRRVQLVSVSALPRCCQAGQGQRDGPDQESESRASIAALSPPRKEHNQPRADTVGHAKREAPAPVPTSSGPSKKERMSFRDNPVQLSLGWGGGKKRSQLRK